MNEAADMYENKPSALKLRKFQTLAEIAKEKNLIVVSIGSDKGHTDSDLSLFMGLAKAAAGDKWQAFGPSSSWESPMPAFPGPGEQARRAIRRRLTRDSS
jgi:hypothetical protein